MRGYVVALGVCAAFSIVAGRFLALAFGMPVPPLAPPLFILSLAVIGFGAAAGLGGYVVWLALWAKERVPLPRVMAQVRYYLSTQYLAERIAPLVFTFLFLSGFNTFKVFIPHVQPFYLDGFLSDLDRWTFGTDPWRLTHAVIGPVGTHVLDICYGLWFPVWLLAILHFSLLASDELRRRFFISFVAVWAVLGIAMAIAMSSAGPCFLQLIHHPYAVRYEALFPLQDAPGARRAQEYLAKAYVTGDLGLAKGISAMPSVHIAVAALVALAVRAYGKFVFGAALLFYLMMFVGSVHLGWHYFSDGVVGTAGALVIWRASHRKTRHEAGATVPQMDAGA